DPRLRGGHAAPPRRWTVGPPRGGAEGSDRAGQGPLLRQEVSAGARQARVMSKPSQSSNLMKPWAWLAAVAAVCLVLASSTALYAINSTVGLGLPWWGGGGAPLLVCAAVR